MISMNGRPDPGVSSVSANKSGPRQGSSSIPSMAELRNPTLVNSQISQQTNVTTSLPLMIRPWLDNYEANFNQGSLIFVNIDSRAHRLSTVADLPTMNFIMENANRKKGLNEPTQPMYSNTKDVDTFQKFGWNLFGVMRNDMAADSQLQKLLNIDVFGRSMVANIWGPLKRGDHVGLALKSIDCGSYGGFVQPTGNMLPSVVIKDDGKDILQLVPTINGRLVDVTTTSADNEAKKAAAPIDYKVHYPLGVVTHAVGRVPNTGQRKMALRSQTHYTLLPRIEILMI